VDFSYDESLAKRFFVRIRLKRQNSKVLCPNKAFVFVSGQKLCAGQIVASYRQESAQQYKPHHSWATALQRRHARQDGLVVRVCQLEPLGERHTLLVTGWTASRDSLPLVSAF
jgi:hypothetical protein